MARDWLCFESISGRLVMMIKRTTAEMRVKTLIMRMRTCVRVSEQLQLIPPSP